MLNRIPSASPEPALAASSAGEGGLYARFGIARLDGAAPNSRSHSRTSWSGASEEVRSITLAKASACVLLVRITRPSCCAFPRLGPGQNDFVAVSRGSSLSQMLDHHALRENLVDLGVAVGDALLVGVAHELLERRAVLVDAVRKRIAVELFAQRTGIGRNPGQGIA